MTVDAYFGMLILALMGLTFIALLLVFLYMVYGEKEEDASSPKTTLAKEVPSFARLFSFMSSVMF